MWFHCLVDTLANDGEHVIRARSPRCLVPGLSSTPKLQNPAINVFGICEGLKTQPPNRDPVLNDSVDVSEDVPWFQALPTAQGFREIDSITRISEKNQRSKTILSDDAHAPTVYSRRSMWFGGCRCSMR